MAYFMNKVQQPAEPIPGDNLLFITKSLGVPGIHLIDLEGITAWVDLEDMLVWNSGPLDL